MKTFLCLNIKLYFVHSILNNMIKSYVFMLTITKIIEENLTNINTVHANVVIGTIKKLNLMFMKKTVSLG